MQRPGLCMLLFTALASAGCSGIVGKFSGRTEACAILAIGVPAPARIVRPNKAGCLDQCAFGAVVVVYPDNVWYGRVTPADVDEIIERHIVKGEIVERLVIPDEQLTGIAPKA